MAPLSVDTVEPHNEAHGGQMGSNTRRYTAEFKAEAVKQVVARGHPVCEVAERLGIST